LRDERYASKGNSYRPAWTTGSAELFPSGDAVLARRGEPVRRLTARARGIVQRVGFRAFAAEEARRLRLTGYVRNCRDGSVETVAEGDEAPLRQLEAALQRGPPGARVDGIETSFAGATGEFAGFRIRY